MVYLRKKAESHPIAKFFLMMLNSAIPFAAFVNLPTLTAGKFTVLLAMETLAVGALMSVYHWEGGLSRSGATLGTVALVTCVCGIGYFGTIALR